MTSRTLLSIAPWVSSLCLSGLGRRLDITYPHIHIAPSVSSLCLSGPRRCLDITYPLSHSSFSFIALPVWTWPSLRHYVPSYPSSFSFVCLSGPRHRLDITYPLIHIAPSDHRSVCQLRRRLDITYPLIHISFSFVFLSVWTCDITYPLIHRSFIFVALSVWTCDITYPLIHRSLSFIALSVWTSPSLRHHVPSYPSLLHFHRSVSLDFAACVSAKSPPSRPGLDRHFQKPG